MKKVLVISSSPRRGGNSDTLCDQFVKGAAEGGCEVEKIFLSDKRIAYCTGCNACYDSHQCVQKDDAAEVTAKMVAADVIVLASPIYFYTVCGQMKTLIDRCCPIYTELSNKEFYFILTAAEDEPTTAEKAVADFQGLLDCLENPTVKGVICGLGAWHKGEINPKPAMREAYEAGLNA